MIEKRIVLIDGKQLADLMIDHDIGVHVFQTSKIKRLDISMRHELKGRANESAPPATAAPYFFFFGTNRRIFRGTGTAENASSIKSACSRW
jgi:hypothetical protein